MAIGGFKGFFQGLGATSGELEKEQAKVEMEASAFSARFKAQQDALQQAGQQAEQQQNQKFMNWAQASDKTSNTQTTPFTPSTTNSTPDTPPAPITPGAPQQTAPTMSPSAAGAVTDLYGSTTPGSFTSSMQAANTQPAQPAVAPPLTPAPINVDDAFARGLSIVSKDKEQLKNLNALPDTTAHGIITNIGKNEFVKEQTQSAELAQKKQQLGIDAQNSDLNKKKTYSELGLDANGMPIATTDNGEAAIQSNAQQNNTNYDHELTTPQGLKAAAILNNATPGTPVYEKVQADIQKQQSRILTPQREIAKGQANQLIGQGLKQLEDKANLATTGPVAGSELGQAIHQFATANLGADGQGIKELEAQAADNLAFVPRMSNMRGSNLAIKLLQTEQPDAHSTPQQNVNKVRQLANEVYSIDALYKMQDNAFQTYVLPNQAAMTKQFQDYAKDNQKYLPDSSGNMQANPNYMSIEEWMNPNRADILQQKQQQGFQQNTSRVLNTGVPTQNQQGASPIAGVSY